MTDLQAAGFQVFKDRRARSRPGDLPRAGIQLGRGLISLNDAAFQALGQPSQVVFAFNSEDNQIALGRANQEPYAYRVRKQLHARSSYLVAARSFLHHAGIQGEGVIRGILQPQGQWLVLDLSSAIHSPGRRHNVA